MTRLLLIPVAAMVAALALSACQNAGGGDTESYRRSHDNYMRTHEPKTGGSDL